MVVEKYKKTFNEAYIIDMLSHAVLGKSEKKLDILIFSTNKIHDFTSLGNLEDVLEFMVKENVISKILFLSSYTVYTPKNSPFLEKDEIAPRNLDGAFSTNIEMFLSYLSFRYNLSVTIFRMFNLYGPFQTSPYIVPSIIEQLINGEDLYIGDKSKIRDFLYVDDFISAIRKVIEINNRGFSVYNVGSGEGKSIEDILKVAEQVTRKKSKIIFDATKIRYEYDYDYAIADISKIERELNWSPRVDLETGISLMHQWIIGRSMR